MPVCPATSCTQDRQAPPEAAHGGHGVLFRGPARAPGRDARARAWASRHVRRDSFKNKRPWHRLAAQQLVLVDGWGPADKLDRWPAFSRTACNRTGNQYACKKNSSAAPKRSPDCARSPEAGSDEWAASIGARSPNTRCLPPARLGGCWPKNSACPVTRLQSGRSEGPTDWRNDRGMARFDFLIFFWDPLEPQPHDPERQGAAAPGGRLEHSRGLQPGHGRLHDSLRPS